MSAALTLSLPLACLRPPRYVAWAGPDACVESGNDLAALLAVLGERQDGFACEEIAVWQDDRRLVAVVLPDGHVVNY